MKKLILMLCFVAGITTFSKAQGQQRRTPEEQAKGLQTQLKLSDDQTAKITAIYKMQAAKRDSMMTASNGDRDAMRQAMRPMMQAATTQIKAVLTADQSAAYDKMMADRMSRMQNGGGAPPQK